MESGEGWSKFEEVAGVEGRGETVRSAKCDGKMVPSSKAIAIARAHASPCVIESM